MREQMAREQEFLDAERRRALDRALGDYVNSIKAAVTGKWVRPRGTSTGLQCLVLVEQLPSGDVIKVDIVESSGNVAFDRSVEQAVLAASPLPRPRDRALFDRQIKFRFNPRQ
jgi:colicin import membrane protein